MTWQESTRLPHRAAADLHERASGPGHQLPDRRDNPRAGPRRGSGPAIGGFCWQQVGIHRVGQSSTDPTLNVDTKRDGIEPDMAFTGAGDTVPWVVWYEKDATPALARAAQQRDGVRRQGDLQRLAGMAVPVDRGRKNRARSGVLDTTGGFGACAANARAEASCSLNNDPSKDAEDPRVAAGTMTAGNPTVPWVVWDEGPARASDNQVFVARLVGTGPAARFVVANGGEPIRQWGTVPTSRSRAIRRT